MDPIRIVYTRLDRVEAAIVNPKKHKTSALKDSIRRFGFTSVPILNTATGRLLAGHGRVQALREMMDAKEAVPAGIKVDEQGMWLAPVLTGVHLANDKDARAYLLADNRLTEMGGWDTDALMAELRELDLRADDVLSSVMGYTANEVDLLSRLNEDDVIRAAKPQPLDVQPRLDQPGMIQCPHCGTKFKR